MKPEEIYEKVKGTPCMSLIQGRRINDIILENKFKSILELGFRHGVSTCYIAGALHEQGIGHVTTIDLSYSKSLEPNIEDLLSLTGLARYVTAVYEPTSYVWRMMKMIESDPCPKFDFCYIDGAHDWFTDGLAFFLVDKLLTPGGLLIFDDLDWTFDSSPSIKDRDWVKCMPLEEKCTPQVRKIYELLVKQHSSYKDFKIEGAWGFARKCL